MSWTSNYNPSATGAWSKLESKLFNARDTKASPSNSVTLWSILINSRALMMSWESSTILKLIFYRGIFFLFFFFLLTYSFHIESEWLSFMTISPIKHFTGTLINQGFVEQFLCLLFTSKSYFLSCFYALVFTHFLLWFSSQMSELFRRNVFLSKSHNLSRIFDLWPSFSRESASFRSKLLSKVT